MQTVLTVVSLVALCLSAGVVALNWAYVIANFRFRRQGMARRISLMHLVPQLLVGIAAILSSRTAPSFLPIWSLWLVALADPALLQILIRPLALLRHRARPQA